MNKTFTKHRTMFAHNLPVYQNKSVNTTASGVGAGGTGNTCPTPSSPTFSK